jgi:hypothetical protein
MAELTPMLVALGYRAMVEGEKVSFVSRVRKRPRSPDARRRAASGEEDNPFAALRQLRIAR